jgi:septal ring factor EnvC (AmiA/AmiB activator)
VAWPQWVIGVLTSLAALLGAYAALKARSIDAKTATRKETQQALDAQSVLLDRYESRIATLEDHVETIEKTAEDAIAARNEMRRMHKECERSLQATFDRLMLAEARISELGG